MKPLVPTGEMTLGPFFPPEFAAGANDLTDSTDDPMTAPAVRLPAGSLVDVHA